MKTKIAIAFAMGLSLCGWTGKAEAFQYVFRGTVTDTTNTQNVAADYLKHNAITITVDGSSASAFYISAQQTDLAIALQHAQAQIGHDKGYFTNDYPVTSLINNDGTTSSINVNVGTSFNQFGPFQQASDGGLILSAASILANIPVDPEQSFGPVSVSGFGKLIGVPSGPAGIGTGGYEVDFSLSSLQGFGSISAVPLPAAAPMFGAALLALAAIGYSARKRISASA
ncbi:hypothetical protein P7D22_09480 [Lichenihabitans sp. Uapishka_5]|uniref:hypothetical protein n=1 Tax=Lichenihabitans sp. Uapishka_5 TaxID=3037302 RepID=UPI0029E821BD|nr:hypothetical protein [Lichenihabitans sp. Uapishka_5]MDX7951399.1 hypothetical protein [Lichenihabitans sp. Uapishka_5]